MRIAWRVIHTVTYVSANIHFLIIKYSELQWGAENAGQDIAGQDNDGQKKHYAWVEIKT